MFAARLVSGGGYMVSRIDLLGFSDAELTAVAAHKEGSMPEQIARWHEEINTALEMAARALYYREHGGRFPC